MNRPEARDAFGAQMLVRMADARAELDADDGVRVIVLAGAGGHFCAKLGLAEPKWALFPLGGSTVRLRRQIPYTLAMDLLLTGRHVAAEEALRIGLIGRVVPDG